MAQDQHLREATDEATRIFLQLGVAKEESETKSALLYKATKEFQELTTAVEEDEQIWNDTLAAKEQELQVATSQLNKIIKSKEDIIAKQTAQIEKLRAAFKKMEEELAITSLKLESSYATSKSKELEYRKDKAAFEAQIAKLTLDNESSSKTASVEAARASCLSFLLEEMKKKFAEERDQLRDSLKQAAEFHEFRMSGIQTSLQVERDKVEKLSHNIEHLESEISRFHEQESKLNKVIANLEHSAKGMSSHETEKDTQVHYRAKIG